MKQGYAIGLLLLLSVLSACHRPIVETPGSTSQQQELSVIDSLMWTQPDSALTRLFHCYDTVSDRHYANLLLAELLYKNYYEQTNRGELLKAVAFYDSVSCPFLAARAHYINGVGYYEHDSVVPACAEYLKTLEIMEERFTEKELVGNKAQFMAMTYTRLTDIFSGQYLHEQAIYFGKQSLSYYYKYDVEPWHIAWMLDETGSHYTMMEQWDSASCFYDKALEVLQDTNGRTYRDIMAARSILSYNKGEKPQKNLELFRCLLSKAEDKQEYLARCLSIGDIFYTESVFDSAWKYLSLVFNESDNIDSKKQAAEWLVDICWSQNKKPDLYAEFLVPFANKEENKSITKSRLTEIYNAFCQKELYIQHQRVIEQNKKRVVAILLGLLLGFAIIAVLYYRKKRKVEFFENQINEEHSLSKKKENLLHFLNERICQEIILSIQQNNIKRSAVPSDYPELILKDVQLQQLALTVKYYFGSFEERLEHFGLKPNSILVNMCHLYLLGLDEKQAAILLNRDYSSIKRYEKKLKNCFETREKLVAFLRRLVLYN
jgi:tetratricopeptide (TPR) repeat protein